MSDLKDSTVFVKKDSMGRIIEKWGNYHQEDQTQNFRHFYFYNERGLITNEKKYWFTEDNIKCIIGDTALYDDVYYQYKLQNQEYILEKETCYGRNYDTNGKFIGRKLYYINDVINDKLIYRDDSMGDSLKINGN
jgi:hypothetical protein